MTPTVDFADKIEVTPETDKAKNYNLFKPQLYNPGCNTDNEIMPLNEWLAYALFGDMYTFDTETAITLMFKANVRIDTSYTARLSNIIPTDLKLPETESTAIIMFWQKMFGYESKHSLDVAQVANWVLRFLVNGPSLETLKHDYSIKYLAFPKPHTIFRNYLTQENYSKILVPYMVKINDETSTTETLRKFVLDNEDINATLKALCHAFLIANAKDINSEIDFDNDPPLYSWSLDKIASNITSRSVNPNKWLIPEKCDFALMRFLHILFAPLSTDENHVSDYEQKLIPDNTDQSTPKPLLLAREEKQKNQGVFLNDGLNDPELEDSKEDGRVDEDGNLITGDQPHDDDFQEEMSQTSANGSKATSSNSSALKTLAEAIKKLQNGGANIN